MSRLMFAIVCLLVGGTAIAGPFLHRRSTYCPGGSCSPSLKVTTSPIATIPCAESKPEAIHVQQPWLLTSETESTSSLQPDTVLEGVPGTGSRLPIGPSAALLGTKVTHGLDSETFVKLKELLSQKPQAVPISLPAMDAETSQRLSRILMVSEWLLWLGGAIFGTSGIARFGPLVVRVVDGLRSVIPAPLPASGTIPGASSLPPASK